MHKQKKEKKLSVTDNQALVRSCDQAMLPLVVTLIYSLTMCILHLLTFYPNSTPKVGYKEMRKVCHWAHKE